MTSEYALSLEYTWGKWWGMVESDDEQTKLSFSLPRHFEKCRQSAFVIVVGVYYDNLC